MSDLCFASKAVWRYDEAFMALAASALEVKVAEIAAGNVWIAKLGDQLAGVVALDPDEAPDPLDLAKLFVEPSCLHRGVGHALLAHAVAEAERRGARRLMILADPNAAAFYERHGALRIGDARSAAAALRDSA